MIHLDEVENTIPKTKRNDLSTVANTIKKTEQKYPFTEEQFAKFSVGHSDDEQHGLDLYKKCNRVFVSSMNRVRGPKYDTNSKNPSHTFIEDHISPHRSIPGPPDYQA